MKNKKTKFSVPMKEVSLMGIERHYHTDIVINGKKHLALVDSGASRTVFDKEMFDGIKNNGSVARNPTASATLGSDIGSDITTIDSFKIGKMKIKNLVTAIVDISNFNRVYESCGVKKILAIIGTDILKNAGVVLDFNKNTIAFNFNNKELQVKNNDEIKRIKKFLHI